MAFTLSLLRTTVDLADDADFVATQTAPPSSAQAISDLRGVEILVEFIDSASPPAVKVGAGSFKIEALRILNRPTAQGGGSIVCSGAGVTAQAARPVYLTWMQPGDSFSVRVTNIVAPAGATKLRMFWRSSFSGGE